MTSALAAPDQKLRVLLVPDSIHWILGTIAKWIARFNPWIDATIISSSVLEYLTRASPELFDQFDVVHLIDPYAITTLLPRIGRNKPIVTCIPHVVEWEREAPNLQGDAVMVIARQWQKDLLQRGVPADQLVLVSTSVDCDVFHPPTKDERRAARREYGFRDDQFVIGFCGKQSSDDGPGKGRKGVDIYQAAMRELSRTDPSIATMIIGPGWKRVVAEFRGAGITCAWSPFLFEHSDLARCYAAMDCFWVTARVEGGPVPLLEAMSCGVASIATPVGLVPDIINDGENGLVAPQEDFLFFASTTSALAANRKQHEQLGRAARATIEQRLSYPVVAPTVLPLYERALQRFHRRTNIDVTALLRTIPANFQAPEHPESLGGEAMVKSLKPTLRKKIQLEEKLAWMAWMSNMRQRRVLYSTALRALPGGLLRWPFWAPLILGSTSPSFGRALLGAKAILRRRLTPISAVSNPSHTSAR